MLFRVSGTNILVQAAVGFQMAVATLNVYVKNVGSQNNMDFPSLAEASLGSFFCKTVQIQISHVQDLTEFGFSLPSSCLLCVHVQAASLPILGTSGL